MIHNENQCQPLDSTIKKTCTDVITHEHVLKTQESIYEYVFFKFLVSVYDKTRTHYGGPLIVF